MAQIRKNNIFKNGLFLTVIFLLLFSWLEQNEHILKLRPLGGVQPTSENIKFSVKNWNTAKFQEGQEAYIKDHFGLRPFTVRLYNEIFDRLFGEFMANGVVMGKEGFLFEENYLLAASGKDFLGRDSIQRLVKSISSVQEALNKNGTQLLICLAPGKGTFFRDKMPSKYKVSNNNATNFSEFVSELYRAKVPLFDVQTWFMNLKPRTPFPLFPKTGIHWSSYGEYLVADSLINRAAFLTKKSIPTLKLLRIEQDLHPRDRDDDIELGMNLLRDLPDFKMAYPKFEIIPIDNEKSLPKTLVIGDSFFYGMYNWGMMEHVFKGGEFWYYNHERLIPGKETTFIDQLNDYRAEIQKFDLVILMLTEANLPRFGFGFMQSFLAN